MIAQLGHNGGPPLDTADLIEACMNEQARRSFWAYRQLINPKLKKGWWQREIARELQQFYNDLVAGLRPMLVIEAPPQHGKSVQVVDFITWIVGHNPELRTIYTSFSERLGVRANLRLQRIMESKKYRKIFPNARINGTGNVSGSGTKLRNKEIVEFLDHEGYFRNTTVRGSITGESLDLGVIDDPIKGREEAGSLTIRDKTWEWLTDDFMTRFSEEAGLLAILTRWHIDDPIGRLIKNVPGVRVLKYPAIAVVDEPNRKAGEALFPEHKSLEFLASRKGALGSSSWEALYQQNPTIPGGEIIRGKWFGRHSVLPKIKERWIFADTAMKTAEHNDYSVFQCWGKGEDNKLYLIDQKRGKWEAPELKQTLIDFWNKHNSHSMFAPAVYGFLRGAKIEDKASGTGLIQDVKRQATIPVFPIERTKDKLTRVMDVVSYIEAGYVSIPLEAPFISDFIAECEAFTADDTHAHDDQIDPLCDAITNMLAKRNAGFFDV